MRRHKTGLCGGNLSETLKKEDDFTHLRDVNLGSLGAGHDHGLEVVEL